jgi:pimeloyl-ACP methyl ester carboxylesterase
VRSPPSLGTMTERTTTTVSADQVSWISETVPTAGLGLHVARAGAGAPVVVLHHDIGTLERLAFYDELARHFTVLVPSHAGYDRSPRPEWMRSVRDVAVLYQWLLAEHALTRTPGTVSLVGLGFGGWIAAEMATMAPRAFRRVVLVGAMGLKPERGEIADQALLSYIDYVRLGFSEASGFERHFGAEPPTSQLEQWDLNREMTFRIAWKPYMYSPTLGHLLGGVASPTLIVWGRDDRIVPLECGERYLKALPHGRLEIVDGAGHFVEMEKPHELAELVTGFVTGPQSTDEPPRTPPRPRRRKA